MSVTIIHNATVVTADSMLQDHAVILEDGKILDVLPSSQLGRISADSTIDASAPGQPTGSDAPGSSEEPEPADEDAPRPPVDAEPDDEDSEDSEDIDLLVTAPPPPPRPPKPTLASLTSLGRQACSRHVA